MCECTIISQLGLIQVDMWYDNQFEFQHFLNTCFYTANNTVNVYIGWFWNWLWTMVVSNDRWQYCSSTFNYQVFLIQHQFSYIHSPWWILYCSPENPFQFCRQIPCDITIYQHEIQYSKIVFLVPFLETTFFLWKIIQFSYQIQQDLHIS